MRDQVGHGAIDEAVALETGPAAERRRFDPDAVVTGAAAGAGVARMLRTVVDDLHAGRCEGGLEPGADLLGPGCGSGAQWPAVPWSRICAAIQKPCPTMKASVRPSMPNSLKLTQVASSK